MYKIVGEPNQEAVITVKIKNNDLTRLEVPVRVISGFIDNYTIKISDIPQKLKQGDKITIKANTYNGEEVLEEAKSFAMKNLNSLTLTMDSDLAKQVQQALEIPLRWRVPRMEARDFIDMYQKYETKDISLLELAKLDYNLVQSVYQQELKELVR